MKKKLLYGILVAGFVALVSINLNMGVGSPLSDIKLSAVESLADNEGPTSGKKMEAYMCRGIGIIAFQKVCKPFTTFHSHCYSHEEESCDDGKPGVGNKEW